MTISTIAASSIALGNGVTTAFNFSFIADSVSDIEVIYTNASGTQTTLLASQYTLVINAPAAGQIWGIGGVVTYPLTGSPIANGTSLTIQRVLPLTQVITISNQGDFAPEVIEEMGDTLEMQIQQVSARGGQVRGTWITGTTYNYGDIVIDGVNGANTTNWYLCAISNTSGTWATDLAAGDWTLILNVQAVSNPGTVAAGGDLTGNYPNPTIAKIQGTTVSGVTGTGNLVFSTSPVLQTPSLGTATASSLTISSLNASQLVATDSGKKLANVTVLPTGTTAATPTSGTADQTVANCAFVNPGSSITTTGYQKFSTGLIWQWGVSSLIPANSSQILVYSIPFPIAALTAQVSIKGQPTVNAQASSPYYILTSSSVITVFNVDSDSSFILTYLALGH